MDKGQVVRGWRAARVRQPRQARGALDHDGLQAGLQALMAEVGHGPVLDALVTRLEGTSEV
ncbi:MAG: hypothetical protein FJZ89_08060 [Chloroflexi bacterium]|nr:hypothetical protein [Chloroflexota bacterium]